MDGEGRNNLENDARQILDSFRKDRPSGLSDLWRSVAEQLRLSVRDPDGLRRAFCELVTIDLKESWRVPSVATDAATVIHGSTQIQDGRKLGDYVALLPELDSDAGLPLELVLLEYEVRQKSSQSFDESEFASRFPREWPVFQSGMMQTVDTKDLNTSMLRKASSRPESSSQSGATISYSNVEIDTDHLRNTVFGDYELLNEIARGGMGVVYKARQTNLNRVVAVKMILAGQLASPEHVRRFYSEAEAAAKLDHPGIVPIYEVGKVGNQHFFSMGYVDGAGLADRVSQGPLTPAIAARILKAVAEATAYAHHHGVIHRDLKPQNILLTSDGHPKITDFGLAKTIEGDSNLTASGQILGTPSYMPPEQAAGRIAEIGPASDVYSLGAVLYCLLTGRPPFQTPNVMETLKQVLNNEPVSPRLLNPVVDRDLETICLKCLEKDPSRRLKSAQELADELSRYVTLELKDAPSEAATIGWSPDGRWIGAVLHQSKAIAIWNAKDGSVHCRVNLERESIPLLAWKPDSSRVAILLSDNSVQVLDLAGNLRTEIAALPQMAGSIEWAPQGNLLAISFLGAPDKPLIELRDLGSTRVIEIPASSYGQIGKLRWSPDGQSFATMNGVVLVVWDLDGNVRTACQGHHSWITDFCWSPDGKRLATASHDQTGRIWNLDGACVATLKGHAEPLSRIQWGAGGRILTNSSDRTSRSWDNQTGQIQETTIWLPEGNAITIRPTGEVIRRSADADKYLTFVVERPFGDRKFALIENLRWSDFERELGISLDRPHPAPDETAENGELDHKSVEDREPANAERPENR